MKTIRNARVLIALLLIGAGMSLQAAVLSATDGTGLICRTNRDGKCNIPAVDPCDCVGE